MLRDGGAGLTVIAIGAGVVVLFSETSLRCLLSVKEPMKVLLKLMVEGEEDC